MKAAAQTKRYERVIRHGSCPYKSYARKLLSMCSTQFSKEQDCACRRVVARKSERKPFLSENDLILNILNPFQSISKSLKKCNFPLNLRFCRPKLAMTD